MALRLVVKVEVPVFVPVCGFAPVFEKPSHGSPQPPLSVSNERSASRKIE